MTCNLCADSSAALAIAKRKGAGKLRHIHVSALWIQDIQDREGASYMNVLGTKKPVDLMTKHLVNDNIENAIDKLSQAIQEGRANSSLDIQGKVMAMNQDRRQAKCVEGNRRDYWEEDGDKIVRVHVQTRDSLFTCPVEDGSLRGQVTQEVGRVRTTRGVTQSGEEFVLLDYWQAARRPNRRQPFQWTGTTTFNKG